MKNSIDLSQVNFPVYKLGLDKPLNIDNVILYIRQYTDDEGVTSSTYNIIDDKNIDKPTLALRRLELMKNKVKLKKLGKAMFYLADLIKLASSNTWLIDSSGNIFQYKKDSTVKLVFKKITKIIAIPTGGAIIEVEGIAGRFKTLYMPPVENQYAGLLKKGMGYILYGTYPEQYQDTKRKI